MNTPTRLSKFQPRTARTRRVLLTGIASLLAAHAGFAADATLSSGAITGDADSGVSGAKTYTAIANIIGNNVAVNGATFIGSGNGLSGTGWALTGVPNNFGGGGNHTTTFGGSVIDDLFDGFQYNGNPGTLTMSGLTVGQTYVTTLYNEAWGLGANRTQTVTSTEGAGIVYNEDALEASVLRYTFVATGATTVLNFAPQIAGNTMHFYGVSNEQVFSNSWTSGADWTTAAWSVAAPNGVGTNAKFTAQGAPTVINLDAARTVGHVSVDGANAWTLSTNNASTLTLQADAGGVAVLSAASGAHTISAPVQFSSAVAKFGAGSVRFTGAVAGTGKGITVGSGALVFETATANLTSVGNIANSGAVTFNNAAAQSYGGAISGTGSLTKSGAGTLTLTTASSYSGSTTVSAGTLLLGGTASSVSVANAGFENTGSLGGGGWAYAPTGADWSFGSNAGISSNNQPWVNTAPEGTHAGFLQTTSLSQVLNFAISTIYDFSFLAANRPGNNPNGLDLQVDGITVASLPAAGFLTGGNFQQYKFGEVAVAAGSRTIAFVVNNTIGGDTATAIDAIAIASVIGVLPSGTALNITTAGAAVDLNGHNQTIGSLAGVAGTTVQNIGAFTAGGDGSTTTFAGVISGTGSLTKVGNGALTLGGANTYNGSTTISAGTLRTTGGSLPANTALNLTGTTAVFDMNGVSHTVGSLAGVAGSSVLLGGGTLAAGNSNASTLFEGNITGAGGVTKQGNGTLILSGGTGHNYSGNTTVSAGTLISDTPNASTTGLAMVAGGATWDLGTAGQTVRGLTGSGNITRNDLLSTGADGAALISTAKTPFYALKLDFGGGGNGGATVNGVTFDNITTTSGVNWSLTGAGVQFGEGNLSGLHTGYDQLVDDFYYNGSPGVLTFSGLTPGQIYNTVLYTKVGLWGGRPQNATFTGGTGSMQLLGTNPDSVGYYAYKFVAANPTMSISMAPTLANASFHWFAASLESFGAATTTLTIGDAGSYAFTGVINGVTKIVKQGSGTQELSGANSYSGGTDINAGAILSRHATGVGSGPVAIASGANYLAWWNTGSPVIANNFTLNGPGGNPGDGLKDAIYADGGGGGFAEYNITGSVTLNATSNIGGHNVNNLRVSGQITGAGGLTKGSGRVDENNTLILANTANDYAGDTVINKGTLKLAAPEVIPHGAGKGGVTIAAGATLDLGGFRETINRLAGTGTITTTVSAASIGVPVFFTTNAASGISGSKSYTHVLDFGDGSGATVNGVAFTSAGNVGGNWSLTGATNLLPEGAGAGSSPTFVDAPNGTAMNQFLSDFYYNGNPATLTLTGLTSGVYYETRLYQRQWGGDRTQLFTIASGAASGTTVFNEDASATPSYLPLRYIADATGTATITTNQIGDGTYHWYGLTNEVAATPKLTVGDAANSIFSGTITGPLEIEKVGTGTLTLNGVTLNFPTLTANGGVTNLNSTLGTGGSTINANATLNINASQTLAALNIADGVEVTFGDGLPFAGGPEKFGGTAAVPEPGSMTLLLGGLAALLGVRRRKA